MPSEALFTSPKIDCDPSRYSAPDNMATEREVSRFIAALVDLLHPNMVLETGTYKGDTAEQIGLALDFQGYGHLDTLESDAALVRDATVRLASLPVAVHRYRSLDFIPSYTYDLMFFDSSIEDREAEMAHFSRFASPRCVWVLHDTRNPSLAKLGGLRLPTPRGVSIGVFE